MDSRVLQYVYRFAFETVEGAVISPVISPAISPAISHGTIELRDVAQLGSAHGWGSCGRRFKSCRPDKFAPMGHPIDFGGFKVSARNQEGKMLTVPNLLTLLRALGIPAFLYLTWRERFSWAVIVLIFAGATDYLDGKLARALKQESRLGELLDPAVDRLYIATVLISMFVTGAIPVWVLIAIVARDLFLGVLLVFMKRVGLPPFKVSYLGKAATFNMLYALPMLLLTFSASSGVSSLAFIFGWAFTGWGIGLYLWTGAQYARTGISSLKLERGKRRGQGESQQ